MNTLPFLFFFKILLPFVTGILAYRLQCFPPLMFLSIALVSLLVLGLFHWYALHLQLYFDPIRGCCWALLMMALGFFRAQSAMELNHVSHFSRHVNGGGGVKVRIISEPVYTDKYIRLYAKVFERQGGGVSKRVTGKLSVHLVRGQSKSMPLMLYGDQLLLPEDCLNRVVDDLPGRGFRYARYLADQQIYHQAYCPTYVWIQHGGPSIYRYSAQIRNNIRIFLDKHFSTPGVSAFSQALLLGDKARMDKERLKTFAETGTMHVLAVSGLHTGMVFMMLSLLCKPLTSWGRLGRYVKPLIIVSGLWGYAFITGMSPSVNRAAFMLSLTQAGVLFGRKSHTMNHIFAAAFFMLLTQPYVLFHLGFQLSFTAVWGIVYIQPVIRWWYSPPNSWVQYVWDLTTVSIAAQAATLPLTLYYFGMFPTWFLLSNIWVIPLIFVIMTGFLLFMAVVAIPIVAPLLRDLLEWLCHFLWQGMHVMQGLPLSALDDVHIHPFEMVMAYVCIICCVEGVRKKPEPKAIRWSLVLLPLFLLICSVQIRHLQADSSQRGWVIYWKRQPVVVMQEGRQAFLMAVSEKDIDQYMGAKSANLRDALSTFGVDTMIWLSWRDTMNRPSFRLQKGVLVYQHYGVAMAKKKGVLLLMDLHTTDKIQCIDMSKQQRYMRLPGY
jgi:competence protein ComEC